MFRLSHMTSALFIDVAFLEIVWDIKSIPLLFLLLLSLVRFFFFSFSLFLFSIKSTNSCKKRCLSIRISCCFLNICWMLLLASKYLQQRLFRRKSLRGETYLLNRQKKRISFLPYFESLNISEHYVTNRIQKFALVLEI